MTARIIIGDSFAHFQNMPLVGREMSAIDFSAHSHFHWFISLHLSVILPRFGVLLLLSRLNNYRRRDDLGELSIQTFSATQPRALWFGLL